MKVTLPIFIFYESDIVLCELFCYLFFSSNLLFLRIFFILNKYINLKKELIRVISVGEKWLKPGMGNRWAKSCSLGAFVNKVWLEHTEKPFLFLHIAFFHSFSLLWNHINIQNWFTHSIDGEGNGNPFHYSCLGNPMDRGAWQVQSMGSQKSLTWLCN